MSRVPTGAVRGVAPLAAALLFLFVAAFPAGGRAEDAGTVPAAPADNVAPEAAPIAPGPGALVLTLEEALRIADERNRDIGKAREFRNAVTGRYVEERAAALPRLSFSANVVRSWDEPVATATGGSPAGTTVTGGEFAVSQALYTWGQVGAALRAARIGFADAEDQIRVFRQAAARDVTAAFYDILLAKELHAIAVRNLEQKERHLDEARKRHAAGTATDFDVLSAEVGAQNARPDVIRARNLVRVSRENLRFLLGVEEGEVDVRGELDVQAVETVPRQEEILALALRNRPELSELRHRREIAQELVRIADAGDKPRLDLNVAAGWNEIRLGPAQGDGKTWSAGLFLSWPIFDGYRTRGRVAQVRSDERALKIDEARLLDAIRLQARVAVDNVIESASILRALSGTVAQAERLLFMAEKGYELGVKTRLDVEDADLNLVSARGNLARARRDYLVSRTNLRYVAGTLVEEERKDAGEFRPAPGVRALFREVLDRKPRLE